MVPQASEFPRLCVCYEDGMNLSDVDLLDLRHYADGLPYPTFEVLRREAPVFWHPEPGGAGFWAVVRHKDVMTVLRDPATFSSSRANRLEDFPPGDPRGSQDVLLNMDPPKHGRYRGLVNKGFSPRLLPQLEPRIRALITEMIDRVAPRGECEFIEDLAGNLPLNVLLTMLGVPSEDRDQVLHWSLRMLRLQDPEYATSPEEGIALMGTFLGYAQRLAAERRDNPREDMLSLLMQAEVEGAKLTPQEFGLLFGLLLAAGHETTRTLIANGMLTLMAHPEQRQRLREDPSLIPGAIEEMLRFAPPVIHFRRTVMRETVLHGQKLAPGDKVVVWFPAANRDEEVFPEPDTFDIGRKPNEHLSFGFGPHFCVGAMLARLEARIAFEELLRRLPDMELAGPVVRLQSNFLNAPKRMPVRFTPSRT
jgi:cytochrome P450